MELTDALDIFEELPHRVQVAVLSNLHAFRSRYSIWFTDYPRPVAEFIQASGLMVVEISSNGVTFRVNEVTKLLRPHMRRLLEAHGVEFIGAES